MLQVGATEEKEGVYINLFKYFYGTEEEKGGCKHTGRLRIKVLIF
jgi:hypothetical protein